MLGSALPAPATLQTSTSSASPSSPTRPSRLRGLSALRNYTHNHLYSTSARENTPPVPRSRSRNNLAGSTSSKTEDSGRRRQAQRDGQLEGIQSNENGWLPTVQGRSGLSRESLNPASTTEPVSPELTTSTTSMNRNRASTAGVGPTPTSELRGATMRRSSRLGSVASPDSTNIGTNTAISPPTAEKTEGESSMPSIRFIPHMDRSNQRPSLNFTAVTRTLTSATSVVRVGRYSERDQNNPSAHWGDATSAVAPVGFKSKVVSRKHCEFWQSNGQWYVKDVKSSSGTFLNHVRLSGPGMESRPFPVGDGDLVQLGIDFKGGEEVIFRCVKIRIEINRGWQKSLNSFNTSEYKKIVNRSQGPKEKPNGKSRDSDAASTGSLECSICLNPVAPYQALFMAPCSHVWHFKCIRNLINSPNYPNFLCPNCRFSADLEADVEPPEDYEVDDFEIVANEMVDDEAHHSSNGGVGVSGDRDESEEHRGKETIGIRIDDLDIDMAGVTNNTSTLRLTDGQDDDVASQLPQPGQSSSSSQRSRPRNIKSSRENSEYPIGARSTTPTSHTPFALAAGVISLPEYDSADAHAQADAAGPMTPRNDAGPFVLDGLNTGHAVDASRALQRETTHVDDD